LRIYLLKQTVQFVFGGPFKGKITTPAFIPIVVEEIAKLKGMKLAEAAMQIYKNFLNFFDVELV